MPPKRGDVTKPRLIDGQHRVALPPEVMRALDIQAGDHIAFEVGDDGVRLRRVKWTVQD